jgi:hypothetical protein
VYPKGKTTLGKRSITSEKTGGWLPRITHSCWQAGIAVGVRKCPDLPAEERVDFILKNF